MTKTSYRTSRRRFLAHMGAASLTLAFASRLRAESAMAKSSFPSDPLYTSAKKQAAMIMKKEISSEELIKLHIARIEAVNPKINAVVMPCYERALMEAKRADEALAKGKTFGPLHGVPCTMKDSHDTRGVVSTGGTMGRRDFIPGSDATYVERYRAAGAILLGKTNTPEFTLSGQTSNLIYDKTHNPYKLGYQPGGSTGGGAAIIAAGGSPFDLGTDFGGSIRGPSHFCGIAGIKPQFGRVPRTGHIVDYGGYFDCYQVIGPMARWVEDLELIMPLISGPDYKDAAILPMPWTPVADIDLKKIKVAYYIENGSEDKCTPETVEAVEKTVALFKSLGVSVVEDAPLALIKECDELRRALGAADGRAWVRRMVAKHKTRQVSPNINMSDEGSTTADEFTRLAEEHDLNRSKFLKWIEPYDLVISPVNRAPAQPWPDEPRWTPGNNNNYGYTGTHNSTGFPGTVVRAGTSPDGLPIGVQLVAKPWREDMTLAAAYFVEAGLGGYVQPNI